MERRDGEVGLGLWRHRARVAEDAHHLQERQVVSVYLETGRLQGTVTKGPDREVQDRPQQSHSLCRKWALVFSVLPAQMWAQGTVSYQELQEQGRPFVTSLSLMA